MPFSTLLPGRYANILWDLPTYSMELPRINDAIRLNAETLLYRVVADSQSHQHWEPAWTQDNRGTWEEASKLAKALQDYIARQGIKLYDELSTPRYNLMADEVILPGCNHFHSHSVWVSTLAHEVVHSTGARSRLCRPVLQELLRHERHTMALESGLRQEEVVAELGALLLCEMFDEAPAEVWKNSVRYIGAAMSGPLGNTQRVIEDAARAVGYIMDSTGVC